MGSLTRLSTGEVIKPNDYSPKILQSLPKKESSSSVEKSKSNAFPRKNNLPGSAVSRGADRIVNALSSVYSEEDAKPTGWGQVAKGTLLKGSDQFVTGLTSTGKMIEGWITKPLEKATGAEGLAEAGPWAVLDRVMKGAQQYNEDQFQEDFESKGKVGEILDKYGTATVAAVPQAALALMTAGSSLGAQAGGAGLQAAGASSGLASTIGSAASSIAKNPQFWLSVAQTAGPAYEEAKADGATDAQASSYALLTSLVNSVVEVGGGIDTLPADLQQAARGGKSGLKVWFNGMLDEGKEEVIQGAISQMSQALYGKQNPIFSTTDQNAVISPSRAADEFLGGAVVGGVLGGGQIAANRILSGPRSLQTGVQEAAQVQSRENTDSPQDVETVMPSVIQEIVEQPVARALRRYVETGTVTNSDATSILQDIDSLYALRKYGVEIQDGMTNSQKRSAVKNGIADMANQADATVSPVNFEQYPNLKRYMDAAESYGLKTGVQAAEQAQQSKVPEAQFFQNVQAQNAQDTQANVQSVGASAAGFLGDTERGYANNLRTDRSMEQAIRENFSDDPEMYFRLSNKETLQKALDIYQSGFENAVSTLQQAIGSAKSGMKLSPEMVPLSRMVANQLAKNGDIYTARQITTDIAIELTESGQLGQAAIILRNADPMAKTNMVEKLISRMNEKLNPKNKIQVPDKYIQEFINAETDEQRDAVLDKIYQNIADQVPSTLMDKFNAMRYLNMLGNLKTQVRNIFGNTAMKVVRSVDTKLRAIMENVAYRKSKGKFNRTTSFFRDKGLYQAAKADYENVKAEALGEKKFSSSANVISSEINDRRTIFKNNGTWGTLETSSPIAKALRKGTDLAWEGLERYRNLTDWAMEYGDIIFSKSAYADALSRYLKANGVTAEQFSNKNVDQDLLNSARQHAIKEAQEATFRDNNSFSDAISSIGFKNADSGWKKAFNIALQGTLPFRRTPANVFVRAYEYSPAGFINTAYQYAQMKKGKATGADVIAALSQSLTGSGLFLLGMALFDHGLLTAGEDKDDKQATLDDMTGKQAYALTLPDGSSYTLDWMSPAIMPMAIGAELMKALDDDGYSFDSALYAFGGVTNVLLNMSMLQGLNDQLSNISYSDVPIVDLAINSLTDYLTQGTTSTLLGQLERSAEDRRMTTYTDKNKWLPTEFQYIFGTASAKTPGVDYQQIPYIDAWGRTEESEPQPFRTFNQMLNPSYVSKTNVTPLDEEIQRLYDATGDGGVVPKRAEKTITVNKEDKDLSADEYVRYATEKGQNAYSLASDLISSSVYQSLSDTDKVRTIDTVYDYANALAKHDLFGDTLEGWIEDIYTSGVDPITAMLYRQSDADAATKRQMLMNDSSLSAEEKSAIDKAVISENSKIDYTSEQTFALSQLSDTGQRKWEKAEAWGMPYEDYVKYYPICSAGGKKKDEIIQDLISAGMSERDAYNFWDIIKKD